MEAVDFSVFEDVSKEVPFERLDAIVEAAVADEGVIVELIDLLELLYADDPYAKELFSPAYLPYVLTAVGLRSSGEHRQEIVDTLLAELMERSWVEDEGMGDYLENCLRHFSVNEYAGLIFGAMEIEEEYLVKEEGIVLWSLLDRVHVEGTEENQRKMCELAMEAIRRALEERGESNGEWAGYRLAEMRHAEALPILRSLLEKMRSDATTLYDNISANGIAECIDILERKQEPYPPREVPPLRAMAENERELYEEWYRKNAEEKRQRVWENQEMKARVEGQVLDKAGEYPQRAEPIRADEKIGRNEPCPCGSGKKYKKCCGG